MFSISNKILADKIKAKSQGKKYTVNDAKKTMQQGGLKNVRVGGSSFLSKVAKTAGKVVSAPIKVTAKVAVAPIKITGKVTSSKGLVKFATKSEGFLKNPVKPVAKVTGKVAKVVKKVPVVGKPLSAVVNLGNAPVKLVAQVTSGDNINQSVLNNLKEQVKSVKEIAPYAKMCISLIPGVGTSVAAAIAAGSALVQGQPITDAIVAGVKGAVPGGMVAQSAFSISVDVLQGKTINNAVVNALPLNTTQKSALRTVVNMTRDLAAGKNVSKSVIVEAQRKLPNDVQKAINIGISLGFGKKNQKPITKPVPITINGKPAPNNVQKLFTIPKTTTRTSTPAEKMQIEGKVIVDKDPILKAGVSTFKNNEGDIHGYYAAIGMMSHSATEAEISKFHSTLPKTDENGFNIGCAAIVGLKQIKRTGNNLKDFGTAVALGLNGASNKLKVSAVKTIARNEIVKEAVLQVATKKKMNWVKRILIKLRIIKEAA